MQNSFFLFAISNFLSAVSRAHLGPHHEHANVSLQIDLLCPQTVTCFSLVIWFSSAGCEATQVLFWLISGCGRRTRGFCIDLKAPCLLCALGSLGHVVSLTLSLLSGLGAASGGFVPPGNGEKESL